MFPMVYAVEGPEAWRSFRSAAVEAWSESECVAAGEGEGAAEGRVACGGVGGGAGAGPGQVMEYGPASERRGRRMAATVSRSPSR